MRDLDAALNRASCLAIHLGTTPAEARQRVENEEPKPKVFSGQNVCRESR